MKKHTFEIFLKIYLKIFYEYIFYILIVAMIDIYIHVHLKHEWYVKTTYNCECRSFHDFMSYCSY